MTRVRWIGVAADIIIQSGGKKEHLQRGDVVKITDASFTELKEKLGWKIVELTPNEIISALCEAYGASPTELMSTIKYVRCPECKVDPWSGGPVDAVTACWRCGGRGSILQPVPRGKPVIKLGAG